MRVARRWLVGFVVAALCALATAPASAQNLSQLIRGASKLAEATGSSSRVVSRGALTLRLQYTFRTTPSLLKDPDVRAYLDMARRAPDDPMLAALYEAHPQYRALQPAVGDLSTSSIRMLEGGLGRSRALGDGCDPITGALPKLSAAIESAAEEAAATSLAGSLPWATQLKDANAAYEATTNVQNVRFIELSRGRSSVSVLFFQTENAALKLLNDRYLLDRELSNAVTNLYKRVFMEELAKDELLSGVVVGRYADYKSIRLALKEDTPEIREHLHQLYEKVAKSYSRAIDKYPQIRALYENGRHTLVRSEQTWHLAGIGATADQASWAARNARFYVSAGELAPVREFDSASAFLDFERRLRRFEENFDLLSERFSEESGILTRVDDDAHYILSRGAIDILRKVPADSRAEYVGFVQRRFKEKFGVELDEGDVELLQDIHHVTESFAPSIYIENQTLIDLRGVHTGFIAIDLAGQNVRNLQATMRSLARALRTRADGAKLVTEAPRTIEELRKGQDAASELFDRIQSRALKAIESEGLVGDTAFSEANGTLVTGDDLLFAPATALTHEQKIAFVQRVGTSTVPSHYRITFVPPNYAGFDNAPIPDRLMAQYVVTGEDLEKQIRIAMETTPSADKMRKVVIAMDVTPHIGGWSTLRLMLGGEVTPGVVRDIRRVATRLVQGVDDVHLELTEIVNTTPKSPK